MKGLWCWKCGGVHHIDDCHVFDNPPLRGPHSATLVRYKREPLTRYGQTVFTFDGMDSTSVTLWDWSARDILNPHRLFNSKRLLVEED